MIFKFDVALMEYMKSIPPNPIFSGARFACVMLTL
jgi:hypothetical protein